MNTDATYKWFMRLYIPDTEWMPASLTTFPTKGYRTKIRFKVLSNYSMAYSLSIDEAAKRIRALLERVSTTGMVVVRNSNWILVVPDEQGTQHRFLVNQEGTLTLYAAPCWEERVGIPVPVGETIPLDEFRSLDVSRLVATRNTLKRTFSKVVPQASGQSSFAKMELMRKHIASVLSDPQSDLFHNWDNPEAYTLVESDRETLWVIRTDGQFIYRLFLKSETPSIWDSICGERYSPAIA